MKSLRNIALAGIVAVGAALSSGSASAHHGGYNNYHYGQSRLCYVPFFKLVQYFGYWQAKRIKARCYFRPYYGKY